MTDLPDYELAGIEIIARGVCVSDGKILLCRAKEGTTTYLPGGHVEFGETGRQALVREMREETGLEVRTGAFLGVVENVFEQAGKPHAEVNLVYALTLPTQDVSSKEDWVAFLWRDIDDLGDLLPVDFRRLSAWPDIRFAP